MRLIQGFATFVLATTSLCRVASAQTAPAQTKPAPTAPAQTTPARTASATPTASQGLGNNATMGSLPTDVKAQTEDVTVTGHNNSVRTAIAGGLMVHEDAPKSVSTITQVYIQQQNPSSNPYQLLRMLPGANVTSPDPLGLTGGNITVRGLSGSEIAFQLEGVPINDVGSAAVYPQEIVDSENIARISLEQGSSDLDTPNPSASGGAINTYIIDPSKTAGGFVDASYGSYSATRGFVRLDSGLIGNTNLRVFGSYSKASDVHWRGPGTDDKQHSELKAVNDWGDGNRVSFAFIINQGDSDEYPSVSAAAWHQNGYGGNNPIGSTTVNNTVYDHNFYKNDGNFIALHPNPFTNIYTSAPSNFTLTDHLTFSTVPYLWYGYGNGGGAYTQALTNIQFGPQTYNGTLDGMTKGTVLAYNPSITQTYRPGIVSKFNLQTGSNTAELGYWFEYSWQRQTGPYSPTEGNGQPLNQWGDEDDLVLSNGQDLQYRDTLTLTRINTVFAGDTLMLLNNKLSLQAGIKYAIIQRDGTNDLPGVRTVYPTTDDEHALPTASVSYHFNDANQVYASVATNFKTPANFALYDSGTYSPKTHLYSTVANLDQRAEISISEELGYRYQGPLFSGYATYFHYNFTNRQLTTSTVDPASGDTETTNISAGGQTNDGVDLEFGTRPIHNFRPYVSAEFLHAVVNSDIQQGTDYVLSTGKLVPNTPQFSSALGIDYDNGHFFGDFDLTYRGHQYADYLNTQAYNGYTTINMAAGYRFPSIWGLKVPTLRLDVQNLTNEKYLDYASSVTTNAYATKGKFGTTISAKTPYYEIGQGFSAIATMSTAF